MLNRKWIIISSAIVLTLIVTAVGVNKSKADSNKVKDAKPGATTEVQADLDDDKVNLNVDAADHGSVILQDGSSSKDIVIKDDKVPSNSTPSAEKDSATDIYNDIVANGSDSYIDAMDDYVNNFLDEYDAQQGSNGTSYDQDNRTVNLNEDAADHGSVMLPGGASSKDIVRR